MKMKYALFIILLASIIGCNESEPNNETQGYSPQSIDEIILEEDSAGQQLLNYINGGGDSLCILNYTYFNDGSSTISQSEKKELIDLAVILKFHDTIYISVEGHTHSDGSESANLNLSIDRAEAVYDFLIAEGISENTMEYKGYGETRPIASNDTPEGKAKNRRVEIAVIE